MKIIINGSNGRIGKVITKMIKEGYKNSSLAGAVDRNNTSSEDSLLFKNLSDFKGEADCIIDFSNHLNTKILTEYGVKRNIPLVIATTGQSESELNMIKEAAKVIPVFLAANTSLGVALLLELARMTVKMMPEAEIEIIEKHHNKKFDSPSGTALLIANEIKSVKGNMKNEIPIHAVRMGSIVGEHEVIVGTDSQTITLKHEAHDKALFAEGAIAAAGFVVNQKPGLYNMKDLIN